MNPNGIPNYSWKSIAKAIVLPLACAALIAGCSAKASDEPAADATSSVMTVKVEKIEKVQIADPAEQVADVLPSAQMNVISKINADVVKVLKKRGEYVNKGDTIVELDATDYQLQRDNAAIAVQGARDALANGRLELQNTIDKMQQGLNEAAKTLNKMKNDYDLGLVTESQLNQAQHAYDNARSDLDLVKQRSVHSAELQVESAQLGLAQAERALEHTTVVAPISGIITELPAQDGLTVSAGFSVAQIQQLEPIKIKAMLTPESAERIRGKSTLHFRISGQPERYEGEVSYLAEVADMQTNAYELNLTAANPDLKFKTGMKVQVVLADTEEQMALAVPLLSIVREGTETYVFVLAGNHAEKRKVSLGRINGLNQEILSGVQEGEQLIVFGQNGLKDQDPVQVQPSESDDQE